MIPMTSILAYASILSGVLSAASWLRASVVKISMEEAVSTRNKKLAKEGKSPSFASVTLDGWDMAATFAAQAKWNSIGAALAAFSILTQTSAQWLSSL